MGGPPLGFWGHLLVFTSPGRKNRGIRKEICENKQRKREITEVMSA